MDNEKFLMKTRSGWRHNAIRNINEFPIELRNKKSLERGNFSLFHIEAISQIINMLRKHGDGDMQRYLSPRHTIFCRMIKDEI